MSGFKDFFLFKWIRQMKEWVESYADKTYSRAALFIMSAAEAVFFPVPPDALLIAMDFSYPKKSFQYALICTLGSLVGAVIGFGIGWLASDLANDLLLYFDPNQTVTDLIKAKFEEYGFWGILLAAITPIPFKVFTLASGIFHYNFGVFFLASAIGRSFRFFAVSALFFFFGSRIKPFVDKYLEVLVIAFAVLLIGGFYVLKVA